MAAYKLVSYAAPDGVRAGLVIDDTVFDAAAATGNPADATMRGILNDWANASARLGRAAPTKPVGKLGDVTLLAPIPDPGVVFCAGANYTDHVQEMARVHGIEPDPDPHTLGLHSWHFMKPPQCVAGPGEVALPRFSKMVDWEAELAAVIGIAARDVPVEKALGHVAGYTIANDVSARDLTKRDPIADSSPFKFDWIGQKCFDGALPLGPWIVPAADVGDPQKLKIGLSVNGVTKQDSTTANMIFTLAEQISDLSHHLTLRPGDVIATGTPAGVGMGRREFLKPGDTTVVSVEKIGELTNRFV